MKYVTAFVRGFFFAFISIGMLPYYLIQLFTEL
ncbi:hypothetical protein PAESOLCIP111_03644 [Paenibacillus solanacearum]|uniref:Uncharacterized protein n=1 Tax=Paenibacillus solanacearum TaxID=2048548 RepID=A0A916K5R6_9BACL|nr:hypothetical protein PAESOLCIP111_03644 [Paenibacillus solanacearum]